MEVYVVTGELVAYEDYAEWPVCAYKKRKHAEHHARKAEARADKLDAWKCQICEKPFSHCECDHRPVNKWDVDCATTLHYGRVIYKVYKVDVLHSPRKYLHED